MLRATAYVVTIGCLCLAVPRIAASQDAPVSFDQLRTVLKNGDSVVVADATGAELQGRISELSSTSLVLLIPTGRLTAPISRDLREEEVTMVRRRGDSLINGTLIGVVAGTLGGLLVSQTYLCEGCHWGSSWVPVAFAAYGAGIGAGAGLGFDALFRGNEVVYSRRASTAKVRLVPVLNNKRRSALLSFRF